MANSASKFEPRDPLDTVPDSEPCPAAANSDANPTISTVPIDEADLGIEIALEIEDFAKVNDEEPITPISQERTGIQRRLNGTVNIVEKLIGNAAKWEPKIAEKDRTPLNQIIHHYRITLVEHFKSQFFFKAWEIARAPQAPSLQYHRITDLQKIKSEAISCAQSLKSEIFQHLVPPELVDELVSEFEESNWETRDGIEKISQNIRDILGLPSA